MIIPLTDHHYVEIVECLNHPASDKAPFGQAVKARSAAGGGWMGWCVAVDDLAPFEERLGRSAVPGNRKFPDGQELVWQQIGIKGLIADPQVPYMLKWEGDPALHPSLARPSTVKLSSLTIAGSAERVTEWLGEPVEAPLDDVAVEWIAPRGTPASCPSPLRRPTARSPSTFPTRTLRGGCRCISRSEPQLMPPSDARQAA